MRETLPLSPRPSAFRANWKSLLRIRPVCVVSSDKSSSSTVFFAVGGSQHFSYAHIQPHRIPDGGLDGNPHVVWHMDHGRFEPLVQHHAHVTRDSSMALQWPNEPFPQGEQRDGKELPPLVFKDAVQGPKCSQREKTSSEPKRKSRSLWVITN